MSYWWAVTQKVALGQGWKLAFYEDLFQNAITFAPDYYSYYENKRVFLNPQWYGDEGDWQTFCMEAAENIGGDEGDVL